MAAVRLHSVTCRLGSDPVVESVDLEVADGELLSLMGPSGAGKTTLLRVIAGLESIDAGRVSIGGIDVTTMPTRLRDVAMVFQSNALFPTHTARGNVEFPLRVRKVAEAEMMHRVRAEGRALGIEQVLDRWPDQLSNAHSRLVQIARAMVRAPKLFLLDEPLEGLDRPTRRRVREEIRRLQSGYGVAMILATTDSEEAMAMGDRIAVIEKGRISQIGGHRALWRQPVSRSVATLTGPMGFIEVSVERVGHGYRLRAPGVSLMAWASAVDAQAGGRAFLGVRPDAVRLDHEGPVSATLGRMCFDGGHRGREVVIGSFRLVSRVGAELTEGCRVRVALDHWSLFDTTGRLVVATG